MVHSNKFQQVRFGIFFICLLILSSSNSQAQSVVNYKDDSEKLTKEFHKGRRDLLRSMLPDSACAVIFANPERNRSADINYEYHRTRISITSQDCRSLMQFYLFGKSPA